MNKPEYIDDRHEHMKLDLRSKLLDHRHAIILIKPSGQRLEFECPAIDEEHYSIQEVLQSNFDELGLRIILNDNQELDERQIRTMYPILREPSEYGDNWKFEVIDHMTSEPIEYYVVEGDEVDEKLKLFKTTLRERWLDKSLVQSYVVENLIHIADREDIISTYDIVALGA